MLFKVEIGECIKYISICKDAIATASYAYAFREVLVREGVLDKNRIISFYPQAKSMDIGGSALNEDYTITSGGIRIGSISYHGPKKFPAWVPTKVPAYNATSIYVGSNNTTATNGVFFNNYPTIRFV